MTFTVVTMDGDERTHVYALPDDEAEALKFFSNVSHEISEAFVRRGSLLVMINPDSFYNPAHIVRIDFSFSGAAELQKAIEASRRSIGFRTE